MSDDLARPKGDPNLIEAVVSHWEKSLGPCKMVFDEIISEFVHIDVYEFGPDPATGLTTFITSGMAEKPMDVPANTPGREKYQFAEIVLQVPHDWIRSLGQVPVHHTWPIKELRTAARLPHKNQSWLWAGHTLRTDPPSPLGPDTQFCASVIWPGFTLPEETWSLEMDDGRKITFLSLGFLYKDELEFTLKHSQDGFMDYLDETDVDIRDLIIFTPDRRNTCATQNNDVEKVKKPWWKLGKN